MKAVVFEGRRAVKVIDKDVPRVSSDGEALVAVSLAGLCGSDMHIYDGRVGVEHGFTLGHEFVGTVVEAGPDVVRVSKGDRVAGCFCTACGECEPCQRGDFHRCLTGQTFGHGSTLGNLQGAQAEYVLVPRANLTLRRVPDDLPDEAALFAGDVMGTAFHAVRHGGVKADDHVAVLGLGPVGLSAVQLAPLFGAKRVVGIDSVPERLELAEQFGAETVALIESDAKSTIRTAGSGAFDVTIDAVGHPAALDMAIRLTRDCGTISAIGVYAERVELHLGLLWLKALTLRTGQANVIAHVDEVLELLRTGRVNPRPLLTRRMSLTQAPEAYEDYAQRKVMKVAFEPHRSGA